MIHIVRHPRVFLTVAPIMLAAAGTIAYFATFEPGADNDFDTRVLAPALQERRPALLFDAGHRNVHSIHGRYRPFARLIESDGCRVSAISAPFTAESLSGAALLVIVNAAGPKEERTASAFTGAECDAVATWVKNGGSLLLVADHHPYGEAMSTLAKEFGVEMTGGWVDDAEHARKGSGDDGQLLFTREGGTLGAHPITQGRSDAERVGVVETFTGQSLKGPSGSTPLLVLSESAMDRIPIASETTKEGSRSITTFKTEDRSAAGRCQGVALRFGMGRVVVLGEAAMLTAQIDDKSGRRFGMNAPGNDDRVFTLNTVRWLCGALGE